jgi:hypothetical protein
MIQGVLGRLFNYGRNELQGTGVSEMLLPPIADPQALRKALQEAIGAVVDRGLLSHRGRIMLLPL